MFQKIYYFGVCAVAALVFAANVAGQNTFNSGSTGADGAFSPTASQTITVPESGVFNYTTVTIPSGITITYARNSRNSPVTILASGNVTIAGSIVLDGRQANNNGGGGQGGPGGFNGGSGGFGAETSFNGTTGDGPGGGNGGASTSNGTNVASGGGGGFSAQGGNGSAENTNVSISAGGARYGTYAVSPLIGGSGGGGGAILIASSGTINLTGGIFSRGGNGGSSPFGYGSGGGGGGGAGGAIRLVCNVITGSGYLYVPGGGGAPAYSNTLGYFYGGTGANGYTRVETYDYNNFNPGASPAFVSFSMPLSVNAATAPNLRITSVAGIGAPSNPLGSLQGVPDVIVPTTQANPVTVEIAGSNIPTGTVVQVAVTPANGTRTTAQSSALAGAESSSTATARVSIPNGMSVITASVVIDLTTTAASRNPIFINGEKVDKIEVAATFGQESQITYITRSGKRIARSGL